MDVLWCVCVLALRVELLSLHCFNHIKWQHVAKGENPSDKYTRGATPHELMENSLWWHEAKWLLLKDKAIHVDHYSYSQYWT